MTARFNMEHGCWGFPGQYVKLDSLKFQGFWLTEAEVYEKLYCKHLVDMTALKHQLYVVSIALASCQLKQLDCT